MFLVSDMLREVQAPRYCVSARATAVESEKMVEKGSLIAPDVASALSALRAEMQAAGNVAAYIVPSEDPHMSEYPPDCCQRRMYISGFTGSAGTVVVTMDAALLWTDGRYYLQAEQQLSESWTLMRADNPGVPSPSQWLATTLPRGAKVAVDPYVHTINSARTLQTDLAATEQELTMTCNLVDKCATSLHPCASELQFSLCLSLIYSVVTSNSEIISKLPLHGPWTTQKHLRVWTDPLHSCVMCKDTVVLQGLDRSARLATTAHKSASTRMGRPHCVRQAA